MNRSLFYPVIKILFLATWGCALWFASPHRIFYAVLAGAGILCTIINRAKKSEARLLSTTGILSLLFSVSNFLMLTMPLKEFLNSRIHISAVSVGISAVVTLCASFAAFFEIVTCLSECDFLRTDEPLKKSTGTGFFWYSFACIFLVYTAVMFLCKYPGNIDPDYKNVMDQIYGLSPVTNHHPYYFTMLLMGLLKLGTWIFKDVNAALSIISVIQVAFVALTEASVIKLLYDLGVKKVFVIICFLGFLLNPVNMFYSFSVWKDTPFALSFVAAVIVVTKICREMYEGKFLKYLALEICLILMVLLRSNGLFVLLLWTVICPFIRQKQRWRLTAAFAVSLVIGFLLKNVVLNMLLVPQPDILESLAIPMQQIATVLHNGDIDADQAEILSRLVDLNEVRENYNPCWVDFVKESVRSAGNLQYLNDNKMLYLKTYIQIGLSHPMDYIKAWLYQTQGYWSIKDSFSLWYDGIEPNTHGFVRTVNSETVGGFVDKYASGFVNVLHIFTYIALYTWTCFAAFGVSLRKRNPLGVLISIPALALFITLLIAVPLDAAFRYAYAYIYAAPVILIVSMLFSEKKE